MANCSRMVTDSAINGHSGEHIENQHRSSEWYHRWLPTTFLPDVTFWQIIFALVKYLNELISMTIMVQLDTQVTRLSPTLIRPLLYAVIQQQLSPDGNSLLQSSISRLLFCTTVTDRLKNTTLKDWALMATVVHWLFVMCSLKTAATTSVCRTCLNVAFISLPLVGKPYSASIRLREKFLVICVAVRHITLLRVCCQLRAGVEQWA